MTTIALEKNPKESRFPVACQYATTIARPHAARAATKLSEDLINQPFKDSSRCRGQSDGVFIWDPAYRVFP